MAVPFASRRLSVPGTRVTLAAVASVLCLATYGVLPAPPARALAPPAIDTSATAGVMTGISCPTTTFASSTSTSGPRISERNVLRTLAGATSEQRAAIYGHMMGLRITYNAERHSLSIEARPACTG